MLGKHLPPVLLLVTFFTQGIECSTFGTCPSSHPFALSEGNWCCMFGMEKNTNGQRCDSSYIDRRSTCCYGDKYTACKQKPCLDYVTPSSGNILLMPDGRWTGTSSGATSTCPERKMFDGYINSFYHSTSGSQAYQWIQVNFGREVKGISKVIMYKRWGYNHRAQKIEVRIGNTGLSKSYGIRQIIANKKCGITSSDAKSPTKTFNCIPGLNGRYMSLQSFKNEWVNIAEINVYTAGNPYSRVPKNTWTTASSGFYDNNHAPKLLMDNNLWTKYAAKDNSKYHWAQIDFGSTVENIKRVDLWKRFEYNLMERYHNVQVRIGMRDNRNHARSLITSNTACGGILPAKSNHFLYTSHICSSLLKGRYLTVQEMTTGAYMEVAEVEVYTAMPIVAPPTPAPFVPSPAGTPVISGNSVSATVLKPTTTTTTPEGPTTVTPKTTTTTTEGSDVETVTAPPTTGPLSTTITMSASSVFRNDRNRLPPAAIDGNPSTVYISAGALDWIQFDLGKEYMVAGIEVTKRKYYEKYLVNLEIRVGNQNAKGMPNTKLLSINSVCTTVSPTASKSLTEKWTCGSAPTGQYVTIQSKARQYIQLAEASIIVVTPGAALPSVAPEKMYLPSLCSNNGDSYCDPNWTPFANMNMALMGYDIVNSDPLAKGGDKGYRSQIFGAVVTDDAGRMVLSDGIAAVDMLECESNFDSKTVSTVKEFKEAQSSSLDISASVEGGYGGYGGKFGYQDSSSAKEAKEKFQSGESVMMISTAECILFKLRLNTYLLPDFTSQFLKALKTLEGIKKTDHLSVRQNAFYKFYKEFGTHYFLESKFGGKLVIETSYSKSEVTEAKMQEEERCRGLSMGFSSPFVNGEAEVNGCAGSSNDQSSGSENVHSTSKITSIGSKPGEDSASWSEQDFDLPQIIGMELAPITDIFVQEHLYRYGIDANKIRDWFLPLDKDFCTNINAKSPRAKQIPCKPAKSGCGIDDKCKIDEVCKSGFDGSYVCELSPAAKHALPGILLISASKGTSQQVLNYDINQPGKACSKKIPKIASWKDGRHAMTSKNGVPYILAENVVYQLDVKANAWMASARIPGHSEFTEAEKPKYQLFALDDGRMWVRHDLWWKSNWVIEDGLAWEGPTPPLGKGNYITTVPIGNNLFFVTNGKHQAHNWKDSKLTYLLNMNTFTYQQLPSSPTAGLNRAGAVITSPKYGKEVMILGGGKDVNYVYKPITETLIYTLKTNTWRRGPNIPDAAKTLTPYAESYGEGLIFMGAGSTVLQYDPTKARFAIRPEASLPDAFGTVAKGKLCE